TLTSLMRGSGLDFSEHNPVATYINGQYWGMYNMREKINEHMLASKHNLNSDEITLLTNNAEIIEGDNEEYNQLIDYINTYDLSDDSNFEYIEGRIDLKQYALYQAYNIFLNNTDWPGNNIKFWKHPETKWRWIMYDTDFGFGPFWNISNYWEDTLSFALDPNGPGWPNPPWSTLLFRKLTTNISFRNQFINRYADELNTRLLPNNILNHIDAIYSTIEPEITAHFNRWKDDPSVEDDISNIQSHVSYYIENMKNFGAWMADAVKRHGLDDWMGIGPGTEEAGGHWSSVEAFLADQPWMHGPTHGTLLLKGPRKAGLERILPYLRSQHHDTHVSLDLEALAANLRHYRGRLNGQRVMAMVKANAYGLGAVTVAKALAKHHVDYFGVAYSDEGVALRQAGIAQPILVMNPGEQSVEVLLEHRLEPELFNWTSLERYGQAFLRHPGEAPGRVHIKVDTGMHRLGFQPSQGAEVAEALRAYPGLEVVSVMSHLAAAEDPQQDAFTRQQFEAFEHFYRDLAGRLGYEPLKQMANTPGAVRHPYLLGDMVRLGIGLYGDSAVPEDRALLQPVVYVN
ncbi:MAG: alanine racemase, partial [Flavobacteriia bacterium]|nr:alanine racemase [Flavobacteriia bacterium]